KGFAGDTSKRLPDKVPETFIERSWRPHVFKDGGIDRQYYELATYLVPEKRLRLQPLVSSRSNSQVYVATTIGHSVYNRKLTKLELQHERTQNEGHGRRPTVHGLFEANADRGSVSLKRHSCPNCGNHIGCRRSWLHLSVGGHHHGHAGIVQGTACFDVKSG